MNVSQTKTDVFLIVLRFFWLEFYAVHMLFMRRVFYFKNLGKLKKYENVTIIKTTNRPRYKQY